MSALSRGGVSVGVRGGATRFATAYGRSPAYRRLHSRYTEGLSGNGASNNFSLYSSPLAASIRSRHVYPGLPYSLSSTLGRTFHSQSHHLKAARPEESTTDSSRRNTSPGETSDSAKTASDNASSRQDSDEAGNEQQGEKKEGEQSEEKQEKKKAPPPPPHGDKSPWQVFTDTLKTEFQASKEWNESTKALASSAQEFTQNETLKRARSVYGAASGAATTTTAKALKSTGKVIGQSAAWTWDTLPVKAVRAGASLTGQGLEKATRPLRETEAYKSMSEVIDDGSSSRYGGWTDREQRKRLRESREIKEAMQSGRPVRRAEKIEEDPEAGTNVTLHKDAAWKESWRSFRDSSRLMQSVFSLKSTYNESENPLISTARSISDRIAGFFAENETAMVIKKFREMDPSFQLEPFLQDMREYILPEVLDAYVKGDVETLKLWLSAAQFQVYSALMHQYTTAGLKSDGRILDIRNVDVLSARMLEPGEIPVFILTCRTQEVHVYRNAKTNELAAGMEDRVQQVTYAIGVTRIPEDVSNAETRGWRLIELQKSARDYM